MKIFSGIAEDMVTDFVDTLPTFCPYCSQRCWPPGDYPYACRCSECASYFHLKLETCDYLVSYGYCPSLCGNSHKTSSLRVIELTDGTLVHVCSNCAAWLLEEELIDGCTDSAPTDGATDNCDGHL